MKKIFYSMMAVALCACSQSEVDDMPTPPQPENNGLKFTVVDNGFVNEDGTRVKYGGYGTTEAYHATFEEGDEIGVFALKSDGITAAWDDGFNPTDAAYTVENVKLTLTGSVWKSETPIDFGDADLLFAYAPYRADAKHIDNKPLFTGAQGSWAISTGNNRFFVHPYTVVDNSGENFELNDWMGAVVNNVTADQTEFTFRMQHMRGMVELTTDKNVELTDLTLAIGKADGDKYHFTPYHIETDDKHVYRILTTEYRSVNTIYATIKEGGLIEKFMKTPEAAHKGAGMCIKVNINFPTVETITVNGNLSTLLADQSPRFLRLAGTLNDADWTYLKGLTTLKGLDLSRVTNTEIPSRWLEGNTTLTSLVLPGRLETICGNALQVKGVVNIDIPTTVKRIEAGAFWGCGNLKVRIPENSLLEYVGDGAFAGISAVYTYDNIFSMVVLPETLTEIVADNGGNTFGVTSLKKVIFKNPNTPTKIDPKAFTGTDAMIYVPSSANYRDKGFFPGKTVIVGPALTIDNYKAVDKNGKSFTQANEGSLSALCDGNLNTDTNYWHSDRDNTHNYDDWGIYIDITLPEGYNNSNLKLSYTARNSQGQLPKKVKIGVSTDGKTFTETNVYDDSTTATATVLADAGGTKVLEIGATSPYKKVRFGVIVSKVLWGSPTASVVDATNSYYSAQNQDGVIVWTALTELTLYEDMWTESAAQ